MMVVVGGGGGGVLYLTLHCHRQNNFCMKMGSGESQLNAPLMVRDRVAVKTVSGRRNFGRERRDVAWNRTGVVSALTSRPPYR